MSTYCKFCGNPVEDNSTFCPNCGAHIGEDGGSSSQTPSTQPQIITDHPVTGMTQQQPIPTYQTVQTVQTVYQAPPVYGNPDADNALNMAIIGLFCFPFILSLLGVVYGIKALQKPHKHTKAIIAIILGVFGLWPVIFFFIW
ncbi:MAG: zinc-ribbon domain-containing protein [Candidatus Heimdallarchaeota archaeon]